LGKEFEGIFPAGCTICDDKGEIDEESQRNLIDFLVEKNVNGLAVSIFGGEFYKFSDRERKRLIDISVDEANGKVPVLFGASHFTTFPVIELGKYAEDVGADGLIVSPPLFDPTKVTLYLQKHYISIANAVNIPIMIQDIDDQTNMPVHMCSTFIAKLQKNEKIKYAKIEGPLSLTKMQEIMELTDRKMILFSGMAGMNLIEELRLGVKGCIPGSALPELAIEQYKEYKKGNVGKAEELAKKYRPFLDFCKSIVSLNPIGWNKIEKETLRIRGIIKSSYQRLPDTDLEQESITKLKKVLEEIQII
jgi:4-hydroxy-tetrahydrodipicolinate synthase